MSEILDCRTVALEKKGHFRKDFFEIFEILKHPHPFWALLECVSIAVRW